MAAHAILSASGSHRWLHCTPSARLEESVADEGSDFAREGSLAHAFCAKALKTELGIAPTAEDAEISELAEYFTDEMMGHVETYTDIVLGKYHEAQKRTSDAVLMVEQTLDFSKYIPEGFGTGDAIIVADGTMEICDFKYGKGVEVSAVENSQMMIYALGAYERFSDEYRIDHVRMTIIQPRIGNLSEYELSVEELLRWARLMLVPTAKMAIEGKGDQVAGEWCQFCKVKSQCKALAQRCTEDFDTFTEKGETVELMTPDEIAAILPKIADIKKWISAVDEFALQQALNGTKYNGYKLVEGRSIRKIIDEEKAVAALSMNGYDTSAIYREPSLKTITDLEGIVGKKKLAEILDGILVKPQGKPTLVPVSDKRQELNNAKSDFADM